MPKKTSPKDPVKKMGRVKLNALEEQLAHREAELAVINSIQTALASNLDFQGIIDAVGDKLGEIFKDGNVGIAFVDKARDLVTFPYVVENRKRLEYFELTLEGSSLMRHILKRRRPLVINTKFGERFDGTGAFNFPGKDQRGVKSWLSVPIFRGDEIMGGMSLRTWERENAYTESDVRLLQTIANSMSVALENARLFDETQRLLKETEQRATELQIINNIGQTLTEGLDLQSTLERVGERLRDALQFRNIAIGAFDSETGLLISHYLVRNGKRLILQHFSLSKYRLGMRLALRAGGRSWVMNTNAEKSWQKFGTVIDGDEIPKSFVMLPLLSGRELVGSITITDYEKENAFTDLPISMLETIASNMGTAIQNARLFDETQRLLKQTEQRATELQIINNIGQMLTEGLDLNSTIERVSERLREVLKAQNIVTAVFDSKTGLVLSPYMVRNGRQVRITAESFSLKRYELANRAALRTRGRSFVVNTNAEKSWRKFWSVALGDDIPKSFVSIPLLAGGEMIGGITIADYEKENAFTDLPIRLLETIASNMGTAIQNVRLFEETRRLFNEAQEARAAAEHANRAKSTFLANMSHELRTPLNAIMGFTSIVRRKAEGILPEKQTENLDKVMSSSQHLLGLINTALDIAKIEAGRMDVIPARFSLSALADQCTNLATPLLKPNVTLEKEADETVGIIYSDADKIKQIVLNLLSNAAKFTHEGTILLCVEKINDGGVSISVTDSGIGISEEALVRVFEEFQQADTSTTRQYGGTGLGLTISRNLARLLGGDLTARSELGKGSTFTLTIPMQYGRTPAPSSDAKSDSVQTTGSYATDNIMQVNGVQDRDLLKTILIVEDTELNINLLTQLLENDYNLLVAKDGAQGVNMAQQNNPDLILMDVSLPILDGYEATRRIRTTMASTPIIGLSAHAMRGDDEKAKEAGCNDYLTKPINEDLLLKKLKEFLR